MQHGDFLLTSDFYGGLILIKILNLNVELHPISLNTELICNGLLKVTLLITLILFAEVHIIGLLKQWKSELTRDCMNSRLLCASSFPANMRSDFANQSTRSRLFIYQ